MVAHGGRSRSCISVSGPVLFFVSIPVVLVPAPVLALPDLDETVSSRACTLHLDDMSYSLRQSPQARRQHQAPGSRNQRVIRSLLSSSTRRLRSPQFRHHTGRSPHILSLATSQSPSRRKHGAGAAPTPPALGDLPVPPPIITSIRQPRHTTSATSPAEYSGARSGAGSPANNVARRQRPGLSTAQPYSLARSPIAAGSTGRAGTSLRSQLRSQRRSARTPTRAATAGVRAYSEPRSPVQATGLFGSDYDTTGVIVSCSNTRYRLAVVMPHDSQDTLDTANRSASSPDLPASGKHDDDAGSQGGDGDASAPPKRKGSASYTVTDLKCVPHGSFTATLNRVASVPVDTTLSHVRGLVQVLWHDRMHQVHGAAPRQARRTSKLHGCTA